MASNSSSSSLNWWDGIEVFNSDYVPGIYKASDSVETNHDLLGGLRENEFDTSNTEYTYGLLALALVFIFAGLLACVLIPCFCACWSKSRRQRLEERLQIGRRSYIKGNLLMLIASVAAIATSAGAIYGMDKTDSGLTNIENFAEDAATDLESALTLPNDASVALNEVSVAYNALEEDISNCNNSQYILASLSSSFDMDTYLADAQAELDNLNADSLDELSDKVQELSDAVATTSGVRKGVIWPAISLSILIIIGFIVFGIGTYECVACGAGKCRSLSCLITPITVFLAVVIWIAAASAVSLSALSGDFCTNPDSHVQELILDNADEDITNILKYYTGDCSSENVAVDSIEASQILAVSAIQDSLPSLYELVGSCEEVRSEVEEVDGAMENLWTILDDTALLLSCENLNGLYQAAVYDNLCAKLPEGLLAFWVSAVILTVLLLVLAVQWNRMLRQRLTEEDVEKMEASSRRRGLWLTTRRSAQPQTEPMSVKRKHGASREVAPAASAPYQGNPVTGLSASPSHPPSERPIALSNPHRPMN